MSGELQYVVRRASTQVAKALGREGESSGAIVLLHGRGTDEQDLLPLLAELDPEARLTGVTLRAPHQLMPGGYHWYIVREIGHPDEPTFRQSYEQVSAWLDEELPAITGVGLDQTVIGGFSQGAIMAYALAFGQGRPSPRAVVALSGVMPEVPGYFTLDLEGHREVPVAAGHGVADPVIPVSLGRSSVDRLRTAGLDVTYHETPGMGHTIDPAFARSLAGWIAQLSRAGRRAA